MIKLDGNRLSISEVTVARKIFRSGNSLVVSLPKKALEILGASAGSEVVIKIDSENRRIYIQPASIASPDIDDNFEAHIDAFIDEFRTALDSLANSE